MQTERPTATAASAPAQTSPPRYWCYMIMRQAKGRPAAPAAGTEQPSAVVTVVEEAGSDDEEDAGGQGDEGEDIKPKIKKPAAKRRKPQDKRTAIHMSDEPLEHVLQLNRQPVPKEPAAVVQFLLSQRRRIKRDLRHQEEPAPQPPPPAPLQPPPPPLPTGAAATDTVEAKPKRKRQQFDYRLVTVMGPLTETQAKIVKWLWNFKSRAVLPRVIWATAIAERYSIKIWHDIEAVFSLKHFDVQHGMDGVVRLRVATDQQQQREHTEAEDEEHERYALAVRSIEEALADEDNGTIGASSANDKQHQQQRHGASRFIATRQ